MQFMSVYTITTGEMAGILYTHGFWTQQIEAKLDNIDKKSRVLPLDLHMGNSNGVFMAIIAGGVVFPQAYNYPGFARYLNRDFLCLR
jgi:hypothetical protein